MRRDVQLLLGVLVLIVLLWIVRTHVPLGSAREVTDGEPQEARATVRPVLATTHAPSSASSIECVEANPHRHTLHEILAGSHSSLHGTAPFFCASGATAMNSEANFIGGVEGQIAALLLDVAKSAQRGSVLIDVGGNIGWFTVMGAANGLRVYTFEPQPGCLSYIRAAVCATKVAQRVTLHNAACSVQQKPVMVPTQGCSGLLTWTDGSNAKPHETAVAALSLTAMAKRERLGRPVGLVKVDTEGSEIDVMESGFPGFWDEHEVANLIVEVMPRGWERKGITLERGIDVLERVIRSQKYDPLLLFDDTPFQPSFATRIERDVAGLPVYRVTDMDGLVRNRHAHNCACNVWFVRK